MSRKTAQNRQDKPGLTAESALSPAGAPPDGELPDVLQWIQSQLPQGGEEDLSIRVYQLLGANVRGGGSQPFLYAIAPEELPMLEQTLAEEYPAGGRFRVTVRLGGRVVKGAMIEIAPRPNYRPPARFQPQQEPQQLGQVRSPVEDAIAQLVKFNMDEAQRNRDFQNQLLAAMRDRPAPADPQATINNTLGIFKAFQEAMPKAAGENIMDVLTKGIEFGKMIAGNAEPAAARGMAGMIETLVGSDMGKALAQTIMQNAGKTSPAPAQLTHQAPQGEGIVRRAPPQYRPAPDFAPPIDTVAPSQESAGGAMTMNQAMQFLFGQAASGADPGILAEQVGAMIPEHVWQALEASEDPVGYLASMYPKVNNFRAWFDRLADSLLEDAPGGEDQAAKPDADVEQHSTV